jgi:hypothetical protein
MVSTLASYLGVSGLSSLPGATLFLLFHLAFLSPPEQRPRLYGLVYIVKLLHASIFAALYSSHNSTAYSS